MIQSGYNPQGGLNTQTQGPAMPSLPGMPGGLPFDPSAAIRERLAREAEDKAYERSMRERAMKMEEQRAQEEERRYREESKHRSVEEMRARNSMSNRETGGVRVDPLAALKAQDRYDLTRRSAAMRPTGLGAQMIPGMAVDPRLLPSRMQPSGSSFQGTPGPSMAGLSPSLPEPPPSSNRGFDFADPYTQSQIQRASFGSAPPRR